MNFKKPKFWDLKKPNLLSHFLFPLTIILQINNFLLRLKSKNISKKVKTICIGNIYLGGTGKTPLTIKLFEILSSLELKIATAKKYYLSQSDEQTILKNETNFITSKTRVKIVEKAIQDKIDLVIFDDGLQDKNLNYDIKFVCFDSSIWIGNGRLIPSGPLRENLSSLKKYDAVFLKTHDKDKTDDLINSIKKINHQIKIFKVFYKLLNLNQFNSSEKYFLFSGIGNPKSLKDFLVKNSFNITNEIIYPDHYKYSQKDINLLKKRANDLGAKLITTEKDYIKILEKDKNDIHYLKLGLEIDNENELLNFIKYKLNETN
ncbi:tetraacyldisaccharide 4'-kinase [Pelagibacterales bacterium SAG-MED39]|nr:tetraacyldisaccharide 4'-kinase [Pelagibacterales bacterium SAG-MED39]